MAINNDVDIPAVLNYLNKKPEILGFSKATPPHTITLWEGGDKQPTDAEINKGWTDYKAEQAATKYQRDRAAEYPSIVDQLDDLYHNGIDGWKTTIKKTKDKYPKP